MCTTPCFVDEIMVLPEYNIISSFPDKALYDVVECRVGSLMTRNPNESASSISWCAYNVDKVAAFLQLLYPELDASVLSETEDIIFSIHAVEKDKKEQFSLRKQSTIERRGVEVDKGYDGFFELGIGLLCELLEAGSEK